MIVPAKVKSGRGKASSHVECMHGEIEEKLNFNPYPGTMNLVSSIPYLLNDSSSVKVASGERLFWPALINGFPVYVYRWKHAPLHVFEILSEVKIRDAISVEDEATVFLTIDETHIGKINFLPKVAWFVIWWKRCEWSYKKNSYYRLTMPFAKIMGATQLSRKEYGVKLFLKESISSAVHCLKRSIHFNKKR